MRIFYVFLFLLSSCKTASETYKTVEFWISISILLSTVIVGIITSKGKLENEVTNKLTAKGKWNRCFIVIAFLLAISQFFIHNKISSLDSEEQKKKDTLLNSALKENNIKSETIHKTSDSIQRLNNKIYSLASAQLDTSKAILTYSLKLNNLYEKNAILQEELRTYLTGEKTIPLLIIFPLKDEVGFQILNTGKSPMWNVKAKIDNENVAIPDIGTLPPKLLYTFYRQDIPLSQMKVQLNFVFWYNNGQSVLIYAYVSRRPTDGYFQQDSIVYRNREGEVFKHPFYLNPPKRYWNNKTNTYHPDMFH